MLELVCNKESAAWFSGVVTGIVCHVCLVGSWLSGFELNFPNCCVVSRVVVSLIQPTVRFECLIYVNLSVRQKNKNTNTKKQAQN